MRQSKPRGAEGAVQNVEKLREYLGRLASTGECLPMRGGDMNRTAIAKACGFNRSVLYDNEDCARMLAEAHSSETRKTPGSAHDDPTGKQLQALENQVQHLETRVACLAAENADLRLKLKRAKAVADELVADGKRIAPYESGGTQ